MRHAGAEALDALGALLGRVRAEEGLVERSRGVFYVRGIAFLHFHEDPAGLFADLKSPAGWRRMRCSTKREQAACAAAARKALAGWRASGRRP